MDERPREGDGPVLEARSVSHRYGRVAALDSASLAVARGECVALVGESGAGKSTLLRCFNRMVEPTSGDVFVDGADVRGVDPIGLRRRIGYVQQDGGLLPHWRVRRNVALVPWLRGDPTGDEAAARALELVGLPAAEFSRRWPAELSGGQRQRVAIARALAARPAVLLLDEPFGALDALTRAELQESFAGLRRAVGVTTLLVTHDLNEAGRLADRIAVLHAGRLEQIGTLDALRSRPATDYVHRLLAIARVREA